MNNRQRGIFLHLVTAEGALTSDSLAQQFDVSSRTIKSDMVVLAAELRENGAELISRRNWGYSIQIVDDERFQALYTLTRLKVGRPSSQDEGARMLYIARKLVAAPGGILLDELAEELYLSRGALRAPLREAVKFCESFHLQVSSIPGQGLRISGEEHLLRMAATELFEMHFHTMELEQADESYARWVACDSQERQDIRHVFLRILRESPFSVRDVVSQRIARYLIIARNRCRAGLHIHLPSAWIREIRTTPLYTVADRIYSTLTQSFADYQMPADETCFLAILIMMGLAPNLQRQCADGAPYLTSTVEQTTAAILEAVQQATGTELTAPPNTHLLLEQTVFPLAVQARYGMDGFWGTDNYNEANYLQMPLEMYYARIMAAALSRQLSCKVSQSDLATFACFVNTILWYTEYPIRPQRLLLTNMAGSGFAQLVSEVIMRRWPNLIESITSMELYEVRRLNEGEYDGILLGRTREEQQLPPAYYNYDAPATSLILTHPEWNFEHIYNDILINAYAFDAVLPKAETIHIYEDFRYYDPEQVFQLLCARYAKDGPSEVRLLSLLRQRERLFTHAQKGCAFLFAEADLCGETCFDIYHLSKPGLWGDQRIEWLVFIGGAWEGLAPLKALGRVLTDLAKSPEKFCDFIETPLVTFRQLLRENVQIAQKRMQ